jgi:hypothetical protein
MVPTFQRRQFRLENSVRARTLFLRTQGLSAAARSISQAVVEAAVRLPAPIDASNLQRTSDKPMPLEAMLQHLDFE